MTQIYCDPNYKLRINSGNDVTARRQEEKNPEEELTDYDDDDENNCTSVEGECKASKNITTLAENVCIPLFDGIWIIET